MSGLRGGVQLLVALFCLLNASTVSIESPWTSFRASLVEGQARRAEDLVAVDAIPPAQGESGADVIEHGLAAGKRDPRAQSASWMKS